MWLSTRSRGCMAESYARRGGHLTAPVPGGAIRELPYFDGELFGTEISCVHAIPPLRTRAFALLFAGQTLSLAGDAAVPVALTLAVYQATGSSGALALVLTCALIPKVLLLPLGGVIGDRFDPRTVALATNTVRAAGQIFVGLELLGKDPHIWQIAVAEAVGGIAGAFSMPTAAPLVRGTVDDSQLLRANALIASVNGAVRLGGPALGGTLVLTAGPGGRSCSTARASRRAPPCWPRSGCGASGYPTPRSSRTSRRAGARYAPGTGTGPP